MEIWRMNKVQIMIYVAFLLFEIMGIAAIMEIYKKQIRKGKAKTWENYLVAEVLSAAAVGILVGANIFKPVLGQLGAPVWCDYILYNIFIYIWQMHADMKLLKRVTKSCINTVLLSYGLTQQQIDDLVASVETKEESKEEEEKK